MRISFPSQSPQYRAADLSVVFMASVDGRQVECAITVEALEDHCQAASARKEDVFRAFVAYRPEIEALTRDLLRTADTAPVIHSGMLRFKRAQE